MSISPTTAAEPIPGYTIRDRLGAGGYGEVWTVEAPGGLEKAIKFVYGYLDESRASRELKALNRIKMVRHPFLLSLERIEIVDGQLLIVTELAEGSLKDRFEECREESLAGIPRAELLRYMADTAEALDYMNDRHGLQHLDVKPENLLMSAERIKVADFGLVKDLQDVNVSMMGGLTPAYAAPEVFNSQPSTRSDQYSLAILFQEMLTGVLPFPGRSAAQLASQHMSARPNVSSLPEADRPVILRALAKDPEKRFVSCREMVEQLAADRSAADHAPQGNPSEQSPAADAAKVGNNRVATQQMQRGSAAETPEAKLSASEPAVASRQAKSPLHARVIQQLHRELNQPLQVVNQPPHDTTGETHLRPHVIVSIGGAAALTTKAFLADMERRHGDLEPLPAIQWLYLDADPRLAREVEESGYEAPDSSRTVIAGLRRVQDYRSGSQRYLKWLSRRWLYNIPKSQTPESMRPLGRLAFVDKQEEISEKLREVIGRATDPTALVSTAQAMGIPFDKKLRIVVIASAAGGVGGGALLDVGDWIRQVLADQQSSAEVQALLLHGTGRQSNRQDLAVANTFATLSEVHDRMRRDWAGEAQQSLPFDQVNMHMLGENLAPEQWREQTRGAARYLSLLLSPAGARWDRALHNKPLDQEITPVHISSFQATVIGKSTDGLTNQLLDSVQADVVRLWRRGSVANPRQTETTEINADPYQVCVDAVREMAVALQLAPESLPGEINQFLEQAAGGSLTSTALELWKRMLPIEQLETLDGKQLFQAVRMAQEFLGIEIEGSREYPDIDPLDRRCDPLVSRFLQKRVSAMRELISGLAEQQAAGLAGADRAADTLRDLLSTMKSQFSETYDVQCREGDHLLQAMKLALAPTTKDRHKTEQPRLDKLLLQYFATACQRLQLRKVLQVVRTLDDAMADLKRNLNSLDRELESLLPEVPAGFSLVEVPSEPQEGHQTKLLRQAAEQLLEHEQGNVATRIDADLRSHALEEVGGFSSIVLEGKMLPLKIGEALRVAVRTHLEQAVQEIRLTEIVSRQQQLSTSESPDQTETAELLQCGGKAHWLLMLPEGSANSTLRSQVEQRIGAEVAVDYHPAGEVALFCFGEEIPLARVGAHLIGHASQFAEIASRLHTRNDVDWLPLFAE